MIAFAKASGARHAIMAGQIHPRNLFDLRPDLKALVLLAKLRTRNAESIFGAIADALADAGVELLPATTFLDDQLARPGLIAGPRLAVARRRMCASDSASPRKPAGSISGRPSW